jgi:hypothetical protein
VSSENWIAARAEVAGSNAPSHWATGTFTTTQSWRCHHPDQIGSDHVPLCMKMIEPLQVFEAVMSYSPNEAKALLQPALAPAPLPLAPPPVLPAPAATAAGDKFTVCVLCYGPHPELAKRCIQSIVTSLPAEQLDLRITAAAVCDETRSYLQRLPRAVIYWDEQNRGKYCGAMQMMFHDPAHPITSPYTVWFDDDAWVHDVTMWDKLRQKINQEHPNGGRMYGDIFIHDLQHHMKGGYNPVNWFKQATWWRGKDLRVRGTLQPAANGTVLKFVSGWFWAIETRTIYAAGIPDARLRHNGDACIGAQVEQAGGLLCSFNARKAMVLCPSREAGGRRGTLAKPFPWCTPPAEMTLCQSAND